MNKNNSNKRGRRPMKRANNNSRRLSDGPSYAGLDKFVVSLPSFIGVVSTTITTGVISDSVGVSPINQVESFAARFGSTFDEYRTLSARAKIRILAPSTCVTRFFWDEKSASNPTLADSAERVGKTLCNNSANPKSAATMSWRARDLLDLQYVAIGTNFVPVYFKIYTDAANYGAPVAVTALVQVEIDITVEFRGLKAV